METILYKDNYKTSSVYRHSGTSQQDLPEMRKLRRYPVWLGDIIDEDVILRTKLEHSNTEAFTQIVRRYEPLVFSLCYKLIRNYADAEDVSQDVFLRMFLGLPSFAGRSSLKNWLMTIARNESIRYGQRLSKRRNYEVTSSEPVNELFPANTDKGLLDQLLEKCTIECRDVLILRIVGDLSFIEIAERLGITLSAAKMRYNRAIKRLRRSHPDLVGN